MIQKLRGVPTPTGWLWWTALLLLIVGFGIAYLITTFTLDPETGGEGPAALVLAVFISLAGICIICATAGWWLRR